MYSDDDDDYSSYGGDPDPDPDRDQDYGDGDEGEGEDQGPEGWTSWTVAVPWDHDDARCLSMPMAGLVAEEPDLTLGSRETVFVDNVPPHMARIEGHRWEDVVMNLRHAVEIGDEETSSACLRLMFKLFASCQDVRLVVVTAGSQEEQLGQLPGISAFSNINALYVHQSIHEVLTTIFFEQIGASTPQALLRLNSLWARYEAHLFYRWDEALACLLGMGVLLCRCYKNGHIFYMQRVFAERSRERYARREMAANLYLVSTCMLDYGSFQRASKWLEKEPVWYGSDERTRLSLFMDRFCDDDHIEYLEQAKFLSVRFLTSYVDKTILPDAKVYMDHMEDLEGMGEAEATVYSEIVFTLAHMGIVAYAQVNNLLGNRRAYASQRRIVIMMHALKELTADHDIRSLGRNGVFAIAARLLASVLPRRFSPVFAQEMYKQGAGRVLPYGIVGNDPHVPRASSSSGPAPKKARGGGNVIEPVVEGHCVVPTRPRSQVEYLHPSMAVLANGNLGKIPGFRRINTPVEKVLGYSGQLFEIMFKWARLRRAQPRQQLRLMDYMVFDLEDTKPVTLADGAVLVRLHPSAYALLGMDPTSFPAPTPTHAPVDVPVFESSIERDEFVDMFPAFDVRSRPAPCEAIVYGPYPETTEAELVRRLEERTELRRRLRLDPAFSCVHRIVVHAFPRVTQKPMPPGVEMNRPASFVIEVPYQYGDGTRSYRDHCQLEIPQTLRLKRHLFELPDQLANVIAYMRSPAGNAGERDDTRVVFARLYAYLCVEPTGATGARVVASRLSLLAGDLLAPPAPVAPTQFERFEELCRRASRQTHAQWNKRMVASRGVLEG